MKLGDVLIALGILGVGAYILSKQTTRIRIREPVVKEPTIRPREPSSQEPSGGVGNDRFNALMVYPTKGTAWYSTAWSNGKPRTIGSDQMDPYDSKFGVRRPGNPTVVIDGKGIATVSGTSPRIQVKGSWRNTELTVYVNNSNARSITLHCRSFEVGGQESAYGCHYEPAGTVWIKKEHGNTYSPRVGQTSGFPIAPNKWVGLKQIVRDVGNGVEISSYMDLNGDNMWKKATSAIDTGGWAGAPFLRSGTQCYVRTNDGKNTRYKSMSCRSI